MISLHVKLRRPDLIRNCKMCKTCTTCTSPEGGELESLEKSPFISARYIYNWRPANDFSAIGNLTPAFRAFIRSDHPSRR